MQDLRHSTGQFPNVSLRWLLGAAAVALLGAVLCAWGTLCLLYWQGSWQLLYHPKAAITRTPASVGLAFDPIHFAATETGTTQLTGWWLPNAGAPYTVLYLHGADGSLSDTVDTLATLHRQNMTIFAIDYRGYGQSQPAQPHPSEKQLRQDAEWALTWLTLTRQIPAKTIVVYGSDLGANLAAKLAADHSELAGIILDQPLQHPLDPVFQDSRSRLIPARLLIRDRYDLNSASAALRIPSLWIMLQPPASRPAIPPEAFQLIQTQKSMAWLKQPLSRDQHFPETIQRWLDDLH